MVKKLFILFPLILSCAGPPEVRKIEQWGRFELVLHGEPGANPFRDVRLEAYFTTPGGKEIRVDGFYDGDGAGGTQGDVFKVRFAPGEPGRWIYRIVSDWKALDAQKGEFDCVASGAQGPLVHDPAEPWYLKWSSGDYFFESGPNDPESFLARDFITQQQRLASIDYLAQAGCNILYFGMVNAGPGDGGAEMKVHPWVGGNIEPDFDYLCLDFMNRLEGVLDRMLERGIVLHLVFWLDDCYRFTEAITRQQEEMWFRYTVARFGCYPNLIWNLAEEYEECFDHTWCENRAALLKEIDPLDHPVTVHQLGKASFTLAGSENFDLTALQFNFTDPDSVNAAIVKVRDQLAAAGRPIPVSLIEWTQLTPEQAEQARKGIWAIATGGGTYQIFNNDGERGSADFARWEAHWRYAEILKTLMESLPLGKMAPDNSLLSRGFCLAAPGTVYLVYQPVGGEFTLELPAGSGAFHAYWIDPRTGEVSQGEKAGPGFARFSAPTNQDWALLVTARPRSFDRVKKFPGD